MHSPSDDGMSRAVCTGVTQVHRTPVWVRCTNSTPAPENAFDAGTESTSSSSPHAPGAHARLHAFTHVLMYVSHTAQLHIHPATMGVPTTTDDAAARRPDVQDKSSRPVSSSVREPAEGNTARVECTEARAYTTHSAAAAGDTRASARCTGEGDEEDTDSKDVHETNEVHDSEHEEDDEDAIDFFAE